MTEKDRYEAEMLEMAEITTQNVVQIAKILLSIRKWIVFWSILVLIAIVVGIVVSLVGWLA